MIISYDAEVIQRFADALNMDERLDLELKMAKTHAFVVTGPPWRAPSPRRGERRRRSISCPSSTTRTTAVGS